MKEILRQHAGRFLFAAVFIASAATIANKLSRSDEPDFETARKSIQTIDDVIGGRRPVANYRYAPQGLNYEPTFALNQNRTRLEVQSALKRVAYPSPSKPQIDPKTLPTPADERHIELFASPAIETAVKPVQGRLLVGIKVPENTWIDLAVEKSDASGKKLVVFEKTPAASIVAAEIFRGAAADAIDTKVPYETMDLLPLQSANVSPEFSNMRVFEDSHVEPQTTYFYKVRLLTRIGVPLDEFIVEKDPKNPEKTFRKTIFQISKDAQIGSLPQPGAKATLIASALSGVVSATAPAEYKFRFAGMNGEFSAPDTEPHLFRQDYAARFDTKVWVSATQEWRSMVLELVKGQALKGRVRGTKKPQMYEFDAHRQLEEVVWRTETTTKDIEDYAKDSDGLMIKDPNDDSKFVRVTKTVQIESPPFKVAIVKDLVSGKLEEYREGHDLEKMDEATRFYLKLVEREQEEARKRRDQVAVRPGMQR